MDPKERFEEEIWIDSEGDSEGDEEAVWFAAEQEACPKEDDDVSQP